jgi:hypothetical protein
LKKKERPTDGGVVAMDSPTCNANDRQRELELEIERYREATASALGQLEWIVGYFLKIGKPEIASVLNRNRKRIVESVRDLDLRPD